MGSHNLKTGGREEPWRRAPDSGAQPPSQSHGSLHGVGGGSLVNTGSEVSNVLSTQKQECPSRVLPRTLLCQEPAIFSNSNLEHSICSFSVIHFGEAPS